MCAMTCADCFQDLLFDMIRDAPLSPRSPSTLPTPFGKLSARLDAPCKMGRKYSRHWIPFFPAGGRVATWEFASSEGVFSCRSCCLPF
jgi:hypothetical protein